MCATYSENIPSLGMLIGFGTLGGLGRLFILGGLGIDGGFAIGAVGMAGGLTLGADVAISFGGVGPTLGDGPAGVVGESASSAAAASLASGLNIVSHIRIRATLCY